MPSFFGASRKVREANKGLGEAPKSCTRKEHESATNSIAKRGQGAIAPCRVKGQRPLWGLGQRPNCSAGDQHLKRTQQRRRQRSVPASNFARPQTRPQATLSPRFREEPLFSVLTFLAKETHLICCIGWMRCVLWLEFSMRIACVPQGAKGWRGRSQSPLLASAGAKSLHKHAEAA